MFAGRWRPKRQGAEKGGGERKEEKYFGEEEEEGEGSESNAKLTAKTFFELPQKGKKEEEAEKKKSSFSLPLSLSPRVKIKRPSFFCAARTTQHCSLSLTHT